MFPSAYFNRPYFDILFFPGEDTAPPTIPGVEYTASAARPHFQALGNKRPHYTASGGRPHYEAVEE